MSFPSPPSRSSAAFALSSPSSTWLGEWPPYLVALRQNYSDLSSPQRSVVGGRSAARPCNAARICGVDTLARRLPSGPSAPS